MWGFATQTGAGLAIAGLTATYYALAHTNYRGEREAGNGDGPKVKPKPVIDETKLGLNASQMLLKKELEELSSLHGSASGLNILYQHHPSHPLYRFQKSRFEITPIISRVHTEKSDLSMSTSVESESETDCDCEEDLLKPKGNEIEGIFDSEPTPPIPSPVEEASLNLMAEVQSQSQSLLQGMEFDDDFEIDLDLELELEKPEAPAPATKSQSEVSLSSVVENEKWRSVQDGLALPRTASPICFFKNPGFGNRFAYRIKNELEPVIKQALSEGVQEDESKSAMIIIEKDSKAVQVSGEEDNYKDSTQFILSPILSESNDSLCDKETPEGYIQDRRKQQQQTSSKKSPRNFNSQSQSQPLTNKPEVEIVEASKEPVKRTNPLEEISQYNDQLRRKMFLNREQLKCQERNPLIRLRADPEVSRLCTVPITTISRNPVTPQPQKRSGKPVLLSGKNSCSSNPTPSQTEAVVEPEIDPNSCGDAPMNPVEVDLKPKDVDEGGVFEEPLLVPSRVIQSRTNIQTFATSRSSQVMGIPSDSWISLPIRVYMNSMGSMPWSLVAFCVIVVIVAGFAGMILSKLANDIAIEKRLL